MRNIKRVVFEFSQEEIDYMRGKLDVQALLTKCKSAEQELKVLRKDKERLDWLEKVNATVFTWEGGKVRRPSIRNAIDTARKETKE